MTAVQTTSSVSLPAASDAGTEPAKQARLQRLLQPRHIAVWGGAPAAEVVRQCRALGFAGDIWPVHPTRRDLAGLPCYPSVQALPCAPDASFVAVPSQATVEVVQALAERGAGGAICYASGFAEIGPAGAALQQQLVQAAGTMPLVGPNCYGLLNYLDGVALWPDQHGGQRVPRGVAIITQSGNIGLNLTMQRRGLPLAYLITVGNQAGDGLDSIVHSVLQDPRVSAIGLHIEGLDDVAAFSRVALQALRQRVPLVALKAGSSELGARITMSHTSSLAGSDAYYEALFQRFGIARVHDVSTLLETLKFLHVHGALAGRRITTASCSGGEASLMADLAQAHGLEMPAFAAPAQTALEQVLGSRVSVSNPLDYHTYIWGHPQAQTDCFEALMQSGMDAHLLVLDMPRSDRCDASSWQTTLDAFVAAKNKTGAVASVVSSLPEGLPDTLAHSLMAHGVSPLQGTADALRAVALAAAIGAAQQRAQAGAIEPLTEVAPRESHRTAQLIAEVASKQALAAYGLPIPAGAVCTAADAPATAVRLGFPVVVKAASATLAHKTEAGGVQLNLQTPEAVAAAVAAMQQLSTEFLVETMARDVVAEMIVGVQRDAQFGLTLTLGAGGILVELLQDARTLLLPLRRDDVHAALRTLKVWPLLRGFRGRPAGDVEALMDAVMVIARYAQTHADELEELDVNPILVQPHGVLAVDALIRISPKA